jgi:hypothetical protein
MHVASNEAIILESASKYSYADSNGTNQPHFDKEVPNPHGLMTQADRHEAQGRPTGPRVLCSGTRW